jgi:hypothetical protein
MIDEITQALRTIKRYNILTKAQFTVLKDACIKTVEVYISTKVAELQTSFIQEVVCPEGVSDAVQSAVETQNESIIAHNTRTQLMIQELTTYGDNI